MTHETTDGLPFLDLPEDVEDRYLETVDDAITAMRPNMARRDRDGTERLYITCQRVFEALGYDASHVGTLAELGIGGAAYLPAVRAAFDPETHIGIDYRSESLDGIDRNYPDLPKEGRGSIQRVVANATDPGSVPGFEAGQLVDAVVSWHPDMSTFGKGEEPVHDDEADEEESDRREFVLDTTMPTQMDNWRQRLGPNGIMLVTTFFHYEAEALVNDPRLAPYVRLCGVTASLFEDDEKPHAYIVALMPTPRAEGEDIIVWRRERYAEYEEYADEEPVVPNMDIEKQPD